jgi:hypothetical protein
MLPGPPVSRPRVAVGRTDQEHRCDRRVQQRPFDLTRATHCADIGGKTPESGGGKVT